MTPPAQPLDDPQFIITADEVCQIIGMLHDDEVNWSKRIIEILEENVCTRPAPASPDKPRPPCEECIYQEQAAQAREDVLDALARDFKGRYVEDAVAEIRRFPESLRQSKQQQEK